MTIPHNKYKYEQDERKLPRASRHMAQFQSKPSAGPRWRSQSTKPPKD